MFEKHACSEDSGTPSVRDDLKLLIQNELDAEKLVSHVRSVSIEFKLLLMSRSRSPMIVQNFHVIAWNKAIHTKTKS